MLLVLVEPQTLFQYELFLYPTFLFDQMLLMRIADKAELQNSIVKRVQSCVAKQFPSWSSYVVDGSTAATTTIA